MASTTGTTTMALFLILFLFSPSFAKAGTDNILYSGETLRGTDDKLHFGIYTFIMQQDCNLVLYKTGGIPIWASNTGGLGRNCACVMQRDGNLVVYKSSGTPLWASNTGGNKQGNYVLILQKDGNVVIYGSAIWATGTHTSSLNAKRGGFGPMDVVSIPNLRSSIIYTNGIDLAKNVTSTETIEA